MFIVHCKTLKEAEEFMDCLGKRGVRWRNTSRIPTKNEPVWKAYENTCYCLFGNYLCGWAPRWYFRDNYKEEKIYSFEEFMEIVNDFYPEDKFLQKKESVLKRIFNFF